MREHRIRVRVSKSREIRLVLPGDFPTGDVDVIVLSVDAGQHMARRKLTVDEFLSRKLVPLPGVGSVTLADMDRAVADGASGRRGV
jgi:hypothetical protein